jgi:uncharacterized protein
MWDAVALDSLAFARDAGEVRGTVATSNLTRLHDVLFDRSGTIVYTLTGVLSKDGIASLRLAVCAELVIVCQRCLGPVNFSLKSVRIFELVPAAQRLGDPAEEADDVEQMHADGKLDVTALVEDETILCLPMVAGHPAGACFPPELAVGESEEKSPFSSLAMLKRH